MTPHVLNNVFAKFERDQDDHVVKLECSQSNLEKIKASGIVNDGFVWNARAKGKPGFPDDKFILSGSCGDKLEYRVPALGMLGEDDVRCLSFLAASGHGFWRDPEDGWRRRGQIMEACGLGDKALDSALSNAAKRGMIESRHASPPWKWLLGPRFRITEQGKMALLPVAS